MALPPEKISIKRRRGEEPIETLLLERDKKRQFTDCYFKRVQGGGIDLAPKTIPVPQLPSQAQNGIPTVRITSPGDADKEMAAYRAAQKTRQQLHGVSNDEAEITQTKSTVKDSNNIVEPISARRFHLTRDLSSALKPNHASGIRKAKWSLRPPMPTFIEKRASANSDFSTIDRMVRLSTNKDAENPRTEGTAATDTIATNSDQIVSRTQIKTFKSPPGKKVRTGQSIRDDPSTWDLTSDQLADELASLAMEMDIDKKSATSPPVKKSPQTPVDDTDMHYYPGDDFVYETYIRVPMKTLESNRDIESAIGGIGLLVIDDEVDDLWQQYMNEDDDDSDWDDEDDDSNAEDNPRNDYPEDEVSSDDEFGRNVYKYRNHASDDEQDEWS